MRLSRIAAYGAGAFHWISSISLSDSGSSSNPAVDYWEAWNEPDMALFWRGELLPDPADYFEYFKAAYAGLGEPAPSMCPATSLVG